jgi:hypothetical protein
MKRAVGRTRSVEAVVGGDVEPPVAHVSGAVGLLHGEHPLGQRRTAHKAGGQLGHRLARPLLQNAAAERLGCSRPVRRKRNGAGVDGESMNSR